MIEPAERSICDIKPKFLSNLFSLIKFLKTRFNSRASFQDIISSNLFIVDIGSFSKPIERIEFLKLFELKKIHPEFPLIIREIICRLIHSGSLFHQLHQNIICQTTRSETEPFIIHPLLAQYFV